MRLGVILGAIVFCGVCSAIPTDGGAGAEASVSGSVTAGVSATVGAEGSAGSGGGAAGTASGSRGSAAATTAGIAIPVVEIASSGVGSLTGGSSDSGLGGGSVGTSGSYSGLYDYDDDDEDSQAGGGSGYGLPLSSAILLSSHHGHRICFPDVIAFSLLNGQHIPFETLLPYLQRHSSSNNLHQEMMFLKAFTKAGQQVWKAIASGHGKHIHNALGNFIKVAGTITSGINSVASKGGHGIGAGIGSAITSGIGAGIGSGISSGIGAGIGSAITSGIGAGIGSGIGGGIGAGISSGIGISSGLSGITGHGGHGGGHGAKHAGIHVH